MPLGIPVIHRRIRGLVLGLCCVFWGLAGAASAQCPGPLPPIVPLADEVLTVSTSALPLTTSVYQQSAGVATLAVVQSQTQPITYRVSGVPTLTVGHVVPAGVPFLICGIESIRAFQVIAGATPATVFVTYYRTKTP